MSRALGAAPFGSTVAGCAVLLSRGRWNRAAQTQLLFFQDLYSKRDSELVSKSRAPWHRWRSPTTDRPWVIYGARSRCPSPARHSPSRPTSRCSISHSASMLLRSHSNKKLAPQRPKTPSRGLLPEPASTYICVVPLWMFKYDVHSRANVQSLRAESCAGAGL